MNGKKLKIIITDEWSSDIYNKKIGGNIMSTIQSTTTVKCFSNSTGLTSFTNSNSAGVTEMDTYTEDDFNKKYDSEQRKISIFENNKITKRKINKKLPEWQKRKIK